VFSSFEIHILSTAWPNLALLGQLNVIDMLLLRVNPKSFNLCSVIIYLGDILYLKGGGKYEM